MADNDEIGKKRAVIPVGTDAGGLLKEGDDVPLTDAEAVADKIAGVQPPVGRPIPLTLEAAGRYLRSLVTDGRDGNKYTVDATPTGGAQTFSLRDSMGHPAPVVTGDGNSSIFATAVQLGIIPETFDPATIAMLKDPSTNVRDIINAIVSNGHGDLLKADGTHENVGTGKASVEDRSDASAIQRKVSSVLQRNRFNPTPGQSPYTSGLAASNVDQRPIGKSQLYLGGYDNRPVTAATGITYEQMKKVGLALMLRSTGGFIGKDGDPTSAAVGLGALVPGAAQLTATRILDRKTMWASDLSEAQGKPAGISDKPTLESDIAIDDGTHSYGSLNTFIEPFGGFAPVGMIALGVALVVAVKLVIQAFLGIAGLFVNTNDGGLPKKVMPFTPGTSNGRNSHGVAGGLITPEDFGIHLVEHDYITAINRGQDVFFQFDGTNFVRVIKSPGYYAVLVRAIVRSGAEVVASIVDAVTGNPNPIGAAQALIGVVDVIKSSTLIGFLNMLAGLGDTVLTLEDSGLITQDFGLPIDPSDQPDNAKVSLIDKLVDNAATHIMKGRAQAGRLPLAWRTSSTPSLFLFPSSITLAAQSSLNSVGLNTGPLDVSFDPIKGTDVNDIEDKLDAEYVPFYFHDLRTNEIVSFHAFLSAINESYSVNYERSKYYGRVDPVMTYSDTDRSINITFNVVATSKTDHDVMWWKINKLVTMLYPQWSKGRKLAINQDTYIQPFSQVPTASPMIRLRLGDLFRSNYSKFALARLFGLGTPDFSLQGSTENDPSNIDRAERLGAKIKEITLRMECVKALTPEIMISEPDGETLGYFTGEKAFLAALQPGETLNLKSALGPLANKVPGVPGDPRISGPTKDDQFVVTIESAERVGADLAGKGGVFVYSITVDDPPSGRSKGPYVVTQEELIPNSDFVRTLALKLTGIDAEPSPEEQAAEDFFSAENNAIVRSFESVRGRGLAGFITSMNIDWHAPTWETVHGSRAPQYCSIVMAFQPIHDITPGLDADGFNRAPVYNVGGIARSIGNDPYDSDDSSREEYNRNHAAVTRLTKKGLL